MGDETHSEYMAHKHARRENPPTSKAAAISMQAPAVTLMEQIMASLYFDGPATQHELAQRLQLESQQINKRTADLKIAGKIEPSGLTRPGPSGRAQTVWRVK